MIILFGILFVSIIGVISFLINKLLVFCVLGGMASLIYIILYSKKTIVTTIIISTLIILFTSIRYNAMTFMLSLCMAAAIDIVSGILCMMPTFIRSVCKSIKIAKISKIIGGASVYKIDINEIIGCNNVREVAYKEFYDFIETNPELNQIIQLYYADRDTLEKIHESLLALGAGQWVKGHYVAISALAFKGTLEYLLDNKEILLNQDNFEERNKICCRIIQYFEEDGVGYIY